MSKQMFRHTSMRQLGDDGLSWAVFVDGQDEPVVSGLSLHEARRHRYTIANLERERRRKCACRDPKPHRDCAYCGTTSLRPGHVCGVCKELGVDGFVIRGTERRVCKAHKEQAATDQGEKAPVS